jgi:hypothetical protein
LRDLLVPATATLATLPARGVQHVLHLHGLDHGDAVAFGDGVARLDEHLGDAADDGRAHLSRRRCPRWRRLKVPASQRDLCMS